MPAAWLAKPLIQPYAGGMLVGPGHADDPGGAGLGRVRLLGMLLILLGRRKKPLIGYART